MTVRHDDARPVAVRSVVRSYLAVPSTIRRNFTSDKVTTTTDDDYLLGRKHISGLVICIVTHIIIFYIVHTSSPLHDSLEMPLMRS